MENGYRKLALAIGINTVVMFFLTYTLIATIDHFYVNINRTYMAVLMALPMIIVMLLVMRGMYPNTRLNIGLIAGAAALFVAIFLLARTQTPVGDVQFLRSMIPHHSSAILMCEQSTIDDPEIEQLCIEIVEAQKREIAQMKQILDRM